MKPSNILILPATLMLSSASLQAQQPSINTSLTAAASKVDLSGSHIELNRVDGDIKLITKYLERFVEIARENGEDIPENFNVRQVMAISGLGDIKALAKSSTLKGDIWLNQGYIETGGSTKGLFSMVGGAATDFKVPSMAPKGTDLAFQLSMDLSQSPELIRSLASSMAESEQANTELKKDIAPLGLSIEEALKKSIATINLAVDFDEDKELELGGISIGRPAFVARFDGLNWIWDTIGDDMIASNNLPMSRTEKDGVVSYKMPIELKAMLQGYLPTIVVDNNKNQIWIASSEEFLTSARTPGNQLIDDPAFIATWKDMPAKGNSMAYVSKSFVGMLNDFYDIAVTEEWIDDEFEAAKPIMDMLVADVIKSENGFTFILANDSQGLHFSNKSPFPTKYGEWMQTLATMKDSCGDNGCDEEADNSEE